MDRPIDPLTPNPDPPKPPKKWSWAVWTPDASEPTGRAPRREAGGERG